MAVIETKYSVGDVVFCDHPLLGKKTFDCPDCLGEKQWETVSPAGTAYTFKCPRCSCNYINNRNLSLEYPWHHPKARQLTIGSVQTDSADKQRPVRYMALETGVGTGQVYDETNLHRTPEAALESSQRLASGLNNTSQHIVERYNELLEVHDYQLYAVPKPKKTGKKK